MNKRIKQYIEEQGKELLYYCYKNDTNFPRSCGVVSTILSLFLFINKEISNKYDINYIRGHYKNEDELLECDCDGYYESSRNCKSCVLECKNCSCDFMVAHSWIELTDKDTKEEIILDYTSCQFHEDIGDIEEEIHYKKFDKEDLLKYISKYSNFIILDKENNFNNYIPDNKTLNAAFIFNISKEKLLRNESTEVIELLKKINKINILKENN